MRIETPQISWHGSESDKGRNAPLLSCSIIESGLEDIKGPKYSQVLATAGNDSVINLWKLSIKAEDPQLSLSKNRVHVVEDSSAKRGNALSSSSSSFVNITHLASLRRHERSVNATKFSPDGLTLATAGDGGSVVLWAIPFDKRGGSNGRHFWSEIKKESDIECRVLPSSGSDAGGATSCEDIFDLQWSPCSTRFVVCSLDHCMLVFEYSITEGVASTPVTSGWKCVARIRDHTHYVQGVAYDPLGVYLCSQGSDRSVRVYSHPQKEKKKGKTELSREATIKFWPEPTTPSPKKTSTESPRKAPAARRDHLFADEATVESFFRRLAWTPDGAFLITPAGILPKADKDGSLTEEAPTAFGTYLFARHCFERPVAVLPGLNKPSVAVRSCPLLFQRPQASSVGSNCLTESMPWRSVFAVLTLDSLVLYDTYHKAPLAIVRGFHYAGLTDCAWTSDGQTLVVTSSDGYISFLNWSVEEVGQHYIGEKLSPVNDDVIMPQDKLMEMSETKDSQSVTPTASILNSVKEGKKRVTPTLVTSSISRDVTNTPALDNKQGNKSKKKRIQPTLVSQQN